jgi:hypothetical protein
VWTKPTEAAVRASNDSSRVIVKHNHVAKQAAAKRDARLCEERETRRSNLELAERQKRDCHSRATGAASQ